LLQIARNFGRIDAGIEISQIPFRQAGDFCDLAGGSSLAGGSFV
jgi:hypothetical protein